MDDAARAARIAGIYERGLAEARRAYDPERHLIGQPSADGSGRSYRAAMSLPLAHALLREGDAAEAAAIVEAVLDTQETTPGHPYRGNFLWLAGDPEVVDLNAVQFVLRGLVPLLVEEGRRLPEATRVRCREALRLALLEEERLDVAPTYTNIHLQALFGLVVGGEWLDDERLAGLGRERWARWVAFTAGSGAPHEFNSPSYAGIDLSALAAIHGYARDPLVKLQARLMYERVFLHVALHLHRPSGQIAGPNCRSYWGAMTRGQSVAKEVLWRETGWDWLVEAPPAALELAMTEHWLPLVVRGWLERQAELVPCEVRETANRAEGFDLTTYLTPGYALGTAARTYGIGQDDFYIEHQANYLLLHYMRPDGWGMAYSRFVVNDRYLGTLAAAPDRSKNANFYEQGNFAGAQAQNRAIALYALEPQHDEVFSIKTVVVFRSIEELQAVRVCDAPVGAGDLPREVPAGEWVVVTDGAVHVGVRPLEPSQLGRPVPIRLERGPAGELWLTIHNYRGAPKRFWDYASLRGAFWRGNLRAGYVMEVAERAEHPDAGGFVAHLRRAVVEDEVDDARVRRVRFHGGGPDVELRYDLWRTEPAGRRIGGAPYEPPMLESPVALQRNRGELRLGDATLTTEPGQSAWLLRVGDGWAVVNPLNRPTRLRLATLRGTLVAERWGVGRIEWRGDGEVVVDCLAEPTGLRVEEA
jgi:hypothetical protein